MLASDGVDPIEQFLQGYSQSGLPAPFTGPDEGLVLNGYGDDPVDRDLTALRAYIHRLDSSVISLTPLGDVIYSVLEQGIGSAIHFEEALNFPPLLTKLRCFEHNASEPDDVGPHFRAAVNLFRLQVLVAVAAATTSPAAFLLDLLNCFSVMLSHPYMQDFADGGCTELANVYAAREGVSLGYSSSGLPAEVLEEYTRTVISGMDHCNDMIEQAAADGQMGLRVAYFRGMLLTLDSEYAALNEPEEPDCLVTVVVMQQAPLAWPQQQQQQVPPGWGPPVTTAMGMHP